MNNFFENADIIHSYSRQNMIDDGLLIVVPEKLAREAGFTVEIGILSDVWAECIAWDAEDSRHQVPQDELGRLWDLLTVLRYKAKTTIGDTVLLSVTRVPRDGKSQRPTKVELRAVIGPGDDPRPVITVMFPERD